MSKPLHKKRQDDAKEIFQIGEEKLRTMLGKTQIVKLHVALDIPYNHVPVSKEVARASLADISLSKANMQANKRGHGQAFEEKVDVSKRAKRGAEVDFEAED